VGHLAVFESMSSIVRPLVTVVTALAGPSPATLFAKLGQFSQAAVKNVSITWKPLGPLAGTVAIEYPRPVPEEYGALWVGAFDYVFETTKKQPGPVKLVHAEGLLTFEVSWS